MRRAARAPLISGGSDGSGKSNFLDAIRFVADALRGSFGDALLERGGIDEVLHRFGERTADFGIGLDFRLAGGARGRYTFIATTKERGGYALQREECVIDPVGGLTLTESNEERQREKQARHVAEARLVQEAEARQAAEARVAELQTLLERQQEHGSGSD